MLACVQGIFSSNSTASHSAATPLPRVAMAYSEEMLLHCDNTGAAKHPESPERLIKILQRLREANLASQCHSLEVARADDEELLACHTQAHLDSMTRRSAEAATKGVDGSAGTMYPEEYNSVYIN